MEKELYNQRLQKILSLRSSGIDPYPASYPVTHHAAEIKEKYSSLVPGQSTEDAVAIAGRITAKREMGKAMFVNLEDPTGKIQLYVRKDMLKEGAFELFRSLDMGDFIGVEGSIFITKTGEVTVKTGSFRLLSKSLRPLPEKWHGLKDIESRYRQRYLDLLVNPEVKDAFRKRSSMISSIRSFLDGRGFLEVETPMLQPQCGGAAAKPFMTHHNALDMDLFLRIAPELYLKRLLVGGWGSIYEINRNFRNEGISTKHNPEFTMLEIYRSYADYMDMLDLCEELICHTVNVLFKKEVTGYQGGEIDWSRPWKRENWDDLLMKYCCIDMKKSSEDEIRQKALQKGIDADKKIPLRKLLDHLFDAVILPEFHDPVFVMDYPADFSPLAKTKPEDPSRAQRFELFVSGIEIANAYSELNDPIEQRDKMRKQVEEKEEGGVIDEDYILALEHGLPPCGGLGIGIDRLVMVLSDSRSIRDVILFPQLKPEK